MSTDAVDAALARQREIARLVRVPDAPVADPVTVAGLDVTYAAGSGLAVAAAVVVDAATGAVLQQATSVTEVDFPYVPGLLAFREAPALLAVLDRLDAAPDLLLCDGQGLAHPQRCGLACHLGVVTGIAAVGAAKNHLVGEYAEPGPRRGDRSPLRVDDEILGEALRTQDGVRAIYVSPGHLVGVGQATDLVLALAPRFRVPDPIRRADHLSRRVLETL